MASRSQGARRGWEHRRERDERVEGNLSPDLVPLWRKVKRGLRCTTAHECYEAMVQYAHDHPGEAVVAMAEHAERDLERLLADERAAIREEALGVLEDAPLTFPLVMRKAKPLAPLKQFGHSGRKRKVSNMARRSAHRRSHSTALARRTVSVKPVVIRQTKVVKAKRKGHRRGGGLLGGLGGGFLGEGRTQMMLAGAALGFLDKSSFAANLPKLPFLGEHGTIAVGAYLLSQGGKNKLAANVATMALGLAAYELVKTGSISGDDSAFGM